MRANKSKSMARDNHSGGFTSIYLLILVILTFGGSVSRAERATSQEMEQVAENWITQIVGTDGNWATDLNPKISDSQEIYEDGVLIARYFEVSTGGYIIVPILKELPPVKAYSEEGQLDMTADGGMALMLRQVIKSRLDLYVETYGDLDAIQPLDEQPLLKFDNRQSWDRYAIESAFFSSADKSEIASVGPLLTSTWHQSAPYNNDCPPGDGGTCLVGCVATAAAQIANYHQWPPAGEGSHEYYWGGDNSCDGSSPPMTLSVDFSDPYNYDGSPEGVAELSYEFGVAYNMQYGVCGSGAYTMAGADVFPDYFRYDQSALAVYRSNYNEYSWFDLIKSNLNKNRPLLYRIYGHAIVCDGWRVVGVDNQYHFNYGWAGSQNIWYAVDGLYCTWTGCDPMVEAMVINLIPMTGDPWLGSTVLTDDSFGDGDGIPEGGETIEMIVTIANFGAESISDVTLTLSIDDASIIITEPTAYIGTIAANDSANTAANPMVFEIPSDYNSRIDSFFIEISWNGGTMIDTLVTEKTIGQTKILIIDDDNNDALESYYIECMDNFRVPCEVYPHAAYNSPDSTYMSTFDVVVWFTGDATFAPLGFDERENIKGFLNNGGNLFLTGQNLAGYLDTYDADFLTNYLKAEYVGPTTIPALRAYDGAQVFLPKDTVAITGGDGASNQTSPDLINAIGGSVPEWQYMTTNNYGGVSYSGADYKLMFFAFGFEAIKSDDSRFASRDTVLARIVDFFNYQQPNNYPQASDILITPGNVESMVDHTPDFGWTYFDPEFISQAGYQTQVTDDPYWSAVTMWDSGPMTGSEQQITYSGLELIDGVTYDIRVRVFDGSLWSTWTYGEFHMNSVPTEVQDMTPSNMEGASSNLPTLSHLDAVDIESNSLLYNYELFDSPEMSNLIASAYNQPDDLGPESSWQVDQSLTEDGLFYWRVRADDEYETGVWGSLAQFWVNGTNQNPDLFDLTLPSDGVGIPEGDLTFEWNLSSDPDPYDQLTYSLRIADNSSFLNQTTYDGLIDNSFTVSTPFSFAKTYYWKVTAYDQFGGQQDCGAVYTFMTSQMGDANGDLSINVGDAVFLINFIFNAGPAPDPLLSGDANCDNSPNVGDAVYIINFVFKGGPEPGCN